MLQKETLDMTKVCFTIETTSLKFNSRFFETHLKDKDEYKLSCENENKSFIEFIIPVLVQWPVWWSWFSEGLKWKEWYFKEKVQMKLFITLKWQVKFESIVLFFAIFFGPGHSEPVTLSFHLAVLNSDKNRIILVTCDLVRQSKYKPVNVKSTYPA